MADINVLVSGLIRRHPDTPSVRILDARRDGSCELIASDAVPGEVSRTLTKPYFAARLTQDQVEGALFLLRRHAYLTPLTVDVHGIASHPEDDSVLGAAASAAADYLVTGDSSLLSPQSFLGVMITSPRLFLDRLNEAPAQ